MRLFRFRSADSDRGRPARRAGSFAAIAERRGLSDRIRHLPGRIVSTLEARDFDVVLMDLNYTPRHHLRPGRSGSALAHSEHRFDPAGDRDDGLGHRETGGRGHAPRRARFHPEALGERAAGEHRQDPDRSEQRHPAGHAPGSREPAAARRRRSLPDRRVAVHAAGAADDFARGPVRRQRPDHRRAGHRQRGGRQDACTRFRRAAPSRW